MKLSLSVSVFTLARMASSRGVGDPMVENCLPTEEKPRAYLRNIPGGSAAQFFFSLSGGGGGGWWWARIGQVGCQILGAAV